MNPDDPVCLCFHVTRRKVINFIRVEKPRRPSQLSECFGAGTGCGWCRPYLERLLEQELATKSESDKNDEQSTENSVAKKAADLADLTLEEYKTARSTYVREGGGELPPGATPIQ